jgi:zinc and cadmium transporter
MEPNFSMTFLASVIAGAVTTAGIFAIRRFEEWARQNVTYFACFAASVLISVSFLHMVPNSPGDEFSGPNVFVRGLSIHADV